MAIDVVIPTLSRCDLLVECLEHLRRDPTPHQVIVVDNASEDDTVPVVREQFPEVRLVELPENQGFGRAINAGIEAGDGEFVVLLNNDVFVEPGFLAAITRPFEDPSVGTTSGVLIKPTDGTIDNAGIEMDSGIGGYPYLGGQPVSALEGRTHEIVGACGAAAGYRRPILEQVGAFDDEIFAYSEDVDLALRIDAEGWPCVLATDARGIHIGSATLGARTLRQACIYARSRGYVAGRYRIGPLWLLTELAIGAADSVRLKGKGPLVERIRGWRRGRSLPRRPVGDDLPRMSWREAMRRRAAGG